MSEIVNKIIVITGASSGIGEATAVGLAKKGAKLVLAARREDRLIDLVSRIRDSGGDAYHIETDVSDQSQVNRMIDFAAEKYGRIDVLINNAGLMPLSFMSQAKVDEWDRMIDVNIKGVLYGIAAVISTMREQKSGHIINLASIAGHKVFPTGGVYCATKHAVRALTEALRQEEQGIRTTIISPGIVNTELPNTISDSKLSLGVRKTYEDAIDPEAIANAIVYAIEQPDSVDVNEITVRPLAQRD